MHSNIACNNNLAKVWSMIPGHTAWETSHSFAPYAARTSATLLHALGKKLNLKQIKFRNKDSLISLTRYHWGFDPPLLIAWTSNCESSPARLLWPKGIRHSKYLIWYRLISAWNRIWKASSWVLRNHRPLPQILDRAVRSARGNRRYELMMHFLPPHVWRQGSAAFPRCQFPSIQIPSTAAAHPHGAMNATRLRQLPGARSDRGSWPPTPRLPRAPIGKQVNSSPDNKSNVVVSVKQREISLQHVT
jgi:hypothetical protein